MGKVGGSAVFVLDFGKGIVSGLIAAAAAAMFGGGMSLSGHVIGYDDFVTVAFLGCVWGHIFSPWLGFKGGKGIAVAVGCLFVTFGWQGACLELAIFAVLVLATKYVSVGSIAAAAACPLFAAVLLPVRHVRAGSVGVHHGRGADGGVGASRQHRAPARRQRSAASGRREAKGRRTEGTRERTRHEGRGHRRRFVGHGAGAGAGRQRA